MNRHRVLVLGVVAVVALGAALWSSQTRRPEQEELVSELLIPQLGTGINDITQFRVRTAGDALQATLKRVEDGWVLVERNDYPADRNALREYLLKLSRARRVEAKTDNPALYDRLGVEEMSAKEAAGTQIEIDGLAQPVKLIIGNNVVRGTGSYVRHAGEAKSWLTDADLGVERETANWLQRDLVDIAAGRMQRVDITPATGTAFGIVRAAGGTGGDFALSSLPKGREPASEFVADATAGFLSGLRFDDVLRAADAAPPATGITRARFVTEDGIGLEVSAWQAGDKTHAQFVAILDDDAATAFAEQAQLKAAREHEAEVAAAASAAKPDAPAASEAAEPETAPPGAAPLAVTDPAKDRERRLATLRADVESMNARFAGKTFVLPSFKATNLLKPFDDYLKPKA